MDVAFLAHFRGLLASNRKFDFNKRLIDISPNRIRCYAHPIAAKEHRA